MAGLSASLRTGGAGRLTSFRGFTVLWAGQSVSFLGSEISSFAVGVWVYQSTGSMGYFGLALLFAFLPGILVSPFAGAVVDRSDLRRLLVWTDAGSTAAKLAVLALLLAGRLELWHVFAAEAVSSVLLAFQTPAIGAATTLLVPEAHRGRASGMQGASEAVGRTAAPLAAGLLIGPVGLAGIIVLDVMTLAVALGALAVIRLPARPPAEGEVRGEGRIGLAELTFGWSFIAARRGLLALVGFGFLVNLSIGMIHTVLTPTVLRISDAAVLGTIMSAAGAAMFVGSAVLGVWGGTRRRIHGFFGAGVAMGLSFVVAGVRPGIGALAAGFILLHLALPFLTGSTQPIWQSKTPVAFQGRVFSIRVMLGRASLPLAYLAAPPLAAWGDRLLADTRAGLSGSGVAGLFPQHGAGLLLLAAGAMILTAVAACALSVRVRRIEDLLPDFPARPELSRDEASPAAAPALAGA
jgi:DHA3 family macrolide efflux protein-like MFS transporter